MSSSLIHWRHPTKGGAACGAAGTFIYAQVDFYGTCAKNDPTLINDQHVPMRVNCKRCTAVHDKWLDKELAYLRAVST